MFGLFLNKREKVLKRNHKLFLEIYEVIDRKFYSEDFLKFRRGLGIASENKKPENMYNWEVTLRTESFEIVYCKQIRGSLVEIHHKDSGKELSYVDQQRQYAGILSWNDKKCELSSNMLRKLILELKDN